MSLIREKLRPSSKSEAEAESKLSGRSTGLRDKTQGVRSRGVEKDRPTGVPGAATRVDRRFADHLRRPGRRDVDPLEYALRDEPDPAAVGRPEGIAGAFGSVQHTRP